MTRQDRSSAQIARVEALLSTGKTAREVAALTGVSLGYVKVLANAFHAASRPSPDDVRRDPAAEARGVQALREAGGFWAMDKPKAVRSFVVPMGMS